MKKLSLIAALFALVTVFGCSGSKEETTAETKPADVKVNVTPEQEAQIKAKFASKEFLKK